MSIVLAAALAVGVILWGIVRTIISNEVEATLPVVTRWLIGRAVRQLPAGFRSRYEEEWLGEIAAYGDRRLSAMLYAIGLVLQSRTLGNELPATDQLDESSKSEDIVIAPPSAVAVIERRRRHSHTPLVEWSEVLATLGSERLVVDERDLQRAEERFAVILAAPSAADRAVLELRSIVAARRQSLVPARAPAPPAVAPPTATSSHPARVPRFGPQGAADPEWAIAPLTRKERRRAEHYRRALMDAEPPPAARRAFDAAIERYDQRNDGRHGRMDHAVRLEVFLQAWTTPLGEKDGLPPEQEA
jgi:hypothetical protein